MAPRRNRLRTIGLFVVVGAIILTFVLFFGQPPPQGSVGPVAEIDGVAIDRGLFEAFRNQTESRLEAALPAGSDPEQSRDLVDSLTLRSLIQRYALVREASELGIRVSDAEVRQQILEDPSFRREGRYDRELLEVFVARSGMGGVRDYTEELRRDLLIGKFQRAIASPVRVPESEVRERATRDLATVSLDFAAADSTDYVGRVELSDEEIAAYANTGRERIRSLYDNRKARYDVPERIRARHILFQGPEAETRAATALAKLRGGAAFAELARELSDDPATREGGGDLGFFPRGRMDPAFEAAAFALEAGQLSEPVETSFGFHLIQLEERQAAQKQSYEEAEAELAAELLRGQRARSEAEAAAIAASEALERGETFEAAAAAAGLELGSTGPFRYTDGTIPGLGRAPALREAAFALDAKGATSTRVFPIGSRFVVFRLSDRTQPGPEELELATERTRERLGAAARRRVLERWASASVDELEKDGKVALYPLYATPN